MDISSATWWSEMDLMNMNDLNYIDHCQMMTTFDDLPFNNNPFTSCTYGNVQASQAAEILLEGEPAFCNSTNTDYQNTSFSSPSTSPPPSSSPNVISFSNTSSPSTTTSSAQNYFEKLKTSVKSEVPSGTTINFSSSNVSLDSNFDDSQQLFQAMGFGADDNTRKKSYSRTPVQAQDHVLAERKRRERLTQYFITLSTLIPELKKLDKASILRDAIKYIKQLEEQVKTLEVQANKYSEEPAVAVKRPRLFSSYDNSSITSNENSNGRTNKSVPDIEVRAADGNVLIRICCIKQARIIKEIFSEIEKFHLTITSSSVIPFGYNTTHMTIVAQMDHQLNMSTEYIANKIRLSIMKLISSHEESNSLVA
ncbi:transcription factor bHLH18-like [Lycium ferocissimum]|uniref:transcription factor bHLH18-like n=1 Tax=Lycium ferocissimum TaxID=112874 RepID=UPI002814A8F2|nr:transcription factor bHLH18-like [Lycium ferocissimum]